MAFPTALTNTPYARQEDENLARVATGAGQRAYITAQNRASAPLCDEHGRLIVRQASSIVGYDTAIQGLGPVSVYGEAQEAGSAPEKDNVGLVVSAKVLEPARFFDALATNGEAFCIRAFGYANVAGWVQLIRKDESGGVNPPILGDIPEVTIPIGANQNFAFGSYPIGEGRIHATYIALSQTGPTYTPAAAAGLWFYHYGYV